MIRNGLAPALLLTLACGGIGEPPPAPDVAAAYTSFGCPDATEEACSLVNADVITFRPTFVIDEEYDEPYCEDEL